MEDRLRRVVPATTAATWHAIAAVVPPAAYLIGGTALALHLAHRRSQDLAFCLETRVDPPRLRDDLGRCGTLTVDSLVDEPLQTLNVFLTPPGVAGGATRIQFLDASRMRSVDAFSELSGVRVAGIGDLLATKLRAIIGRAALRDYYDLMMIETEGHRSVDEGLALYVERYQPSEPDQAMRTIINALATSEDLEADPEPVNLRTGRAVGLSEISSYWSRRAREVVAHLDRGDA